MLKKNIISTVVIAVLMTSCTVPETDPVPFTSPAAAETSSVYVTAPVSETEKITGIIKEANDETYTTPYGTFKPIPHILEINRYMTDNPELLDRSLSLVYITHDGGSDEAEEIRLRIKALSDEICAGLEDDRSNA